MPMPVLPRLFLIAALAGVPSLALVQAAPAAQAVTSYTSYAHPEAEYVVALPEAPRVQTIWANDKLGVPYLTEPPAYGALGETGTFIRREPLTGDTFDVRMTFLKADKAFLEGLTRETMLKTLRDDFQDVTLDKVEEKFSAGSQTLKWATITGYSVNKDNDLFFHAAHYMVGLSSINVLRVSYNIENKTYQEYYKKLAGSLRYIGQ